MVVYYNEAKEALNSMKKVLEIINEKLKDDKILGDLKENERYKKKKKLVEKNINDWEQFINE